MKKWLMAAVVLCLFLGAGLAYVQAEVDNCKQFEANSGDLARCIDRQIDQLGKDLASSKAATAPLEGEVMRLEKQIASIQAQIKAAEKKMQNLEAGIKQREQDLAKQTVLLAEKTKAYYKRIRSESMLVMMLSSLGSGEVSREMGYREKTAQNDRAIIVNLSTEIGTLETDKINVEKSKKSLAVSQANLDKQADFFRKEVAGAKAFQASLEGKIASLTALQQSILSGKNETFQTSVGDVPLADDPNSRPDYNPGFSPAFAAFSFGAPHFKGMSQYGAYGRAKSGQGAETILKAYYGDVEIKKDYDAGKQISVAGYGRMDIETYVKRIYEMPGGWGDSGGMEALKAQAVAARSYALAWTREGTGGAICTTQACQVYKNANKGGKWEEAVNATRGWVVMKGGKVVSTWYASTSGGYQESYNALDYLKAGLSYSTPSFWDTPSGRGGWTSQAYEKTAGSPWFYKGWYKDSGGSSCGRSHPWLNSEEMADILNAWSVLYQGNGDAGRVVPLGGCWGGNPYSLSELRDKGGYSSVSGVSVVYSDGGYTDSVTFDTNKGSVTIKGSEFKKAFNLRAPGRIALKSGLFNMEKK